MIWAQSTWKCSVPSRKTTSAMWAVEACLECSMERKQSWPALWFSAVNTGAPQTCLQLKDDASKLPQKRSNKSPIMAIKVLKLPLWSKIAISFPSGYSVFVPIVFLTVIHEESGSKETCGGERSSVLPPHPQKPRLTQLEKQKWKGYILQAGWNAMNIFTMYSIYSIYKDIQQRTWHRKPASPPQQGRVPPQNPFSPFPPFFPKKD